MSRIIDSSLSLNEPKKYLDLPDLYISAFHLHEWVVNDGGANLIIIKTLSSPSLRHLESCLPLERDLYASSSSANDCACWDFDSTNK